jgi:hypothetical protein
MCGAALAATVRIELVDSRTEPLKIVDGKGRTVRWQMIAEGSYVPGAVPNGRLKRSAQRAHAAAAPRVPLDTIELRVQVCHGNGGQATRDGDQLGE